MLRNKTSLLLLLSAIFLVLTGFLLFDKFFLSQVRASQNPVITLSAPLDYASFFTDTSTTRNCHTRTDLGKTSFVGDCLSCPPGYSRGGQGGVFGDCTCQKVFTSSCGQECQDYFSYQGTVKVETKDKEAGIFCSELDVSTKRKCRQYQDSGKNILGQCYSCPDGYTRLSNSCLCYKDSVSQCGQLCPTNEPGYVDLGEVETCSISITPGLTIIFFEAKAYDPLEAEAKIRMEVDNDPTNQIDWKIVCDYDNDWKLAGAGDYQYRRVCSARITQPGNYKWRARAINKAGYQSDWQERSFSIVATPTPTPTSSPTPTVTPPISPTPSPSPGIFDFSLFVSPSSGSVIRGRETSSSLITQLLSGQTERVTFSAENVPSGIDVYFSPSSCEPSCNTTVWFSTSSSVPAAAYLINLRAQAGALLKAVNYYLNVVVLLSSPSLYGPANEATVSSLAPTLEWSSVPGALIYQYEIAGVELGKSSFNYLTVASGRLSPDKTYSWRVRACSDENLFNCGPWSDWWRFKTKKEEFDFSISANPFSGSIKAGEDVTTSISATLISGNPERVYFSTDGQPEGAKIDLSLNSCKPDCALTMTIRTAKETSPGEYSIFITAKTDNFDLIKKARYNLLIVKETAPVVEKLLEINFPLGQETLERGKTYDISWTARNLNKLGIALYRNQKLYPPLIAKNISAASGKYSWYVPLEFPERDNYQIAVFEYPWREGKLAGFSSFFAIKKETTPVFIKSLQVIFPNGKEELERGKSYEILWSESNIDRIGIALYYGRKRYKPLIAKNIPGFVSKYVFNVPLELKERNDYRIGVFEYPWKKGKLADFSDENFRIR